MTEHDDEILYCRWHPKVETVLRCYQCGAPICVKCAQRTPVGYICPDCKKGRKQRFEQAKPTDYGIAAVVSLILGAIAGFLPLVGWFVVFLSPLAGTAIAEVVWRLVGCRYGQHYWWIVGAAIALGGAPLLLLSLLGGVSSLMSGNAWGAIGILWPVVHIAMAVGTAVTRLRLR